MLDPRRASLRLPARADSISTARAFLRRALVDRGLDHLVDTATLLVSELATNVLLHAGGDFEVRIAPGDERLRVTVLDGSPSAPVRRRYGLDAGTGRGLALVDTLAAAWDTGPGQDGWAKGVWFELALAPDEQEPTGEGALFGEDWLALVDDL